MGHIPAEASPEREAEQDSTGRGLPEPSWVHGRCVRWLGSRMSGSSQQFRRALRLQGGRVLGQRLDPSATPRHPISTSGCIQQHPTWCRRRCSEQVGSQGPIAMKRSRARAPTATLRRSPCGVRIQGCSRHHPMRNGSQSRGQLRASCSL